MYRQAILTINIGLLETHIVTKSMIMGGTEKCGGIWHTRSCVYKNSNANRLSVYFTYRYCCSSCSNEITLQLSYVFDSPLSTTKSNIYRSLVTYIASESHKHMYMYIYIYSVAMQLVPQPIRYQNDGKN